MDQFEFTSKARRNIGALLIAGILVSVLGVFTSHEEHIGNRFWVNMLIDGFFFFGIALAATFFMAVQYAAQSAWAVVVKRIFEAVSSYIYYGAAALIVVFIASTMHMNHIYHWMDADAVAADPILQHKSAYLNIPFWWIRTLLYLGVWSFFAYYFRKKSLLEDSEGGTSIFKKNITMAAIFLVFFGYTSSTASWDWIMSIDAHWFSTLFGWYTFSGMWISAMITIAMLTLYLKRNGYLSQVNESHIHDLGKWMFAVSFLWSYLFFCQFMLIWYSDIPEEVTYYLARFGDYKIIFWSTFAINFIFPMLFLMSRDTKRGYFYLSFVGAIIFIGHWLDTYMMITPGSLKEHGHIGLLEVGLFMAFLGLFLYVVLNSLTKASLVVKHHPYLDESLHHHI